MKASLDERGLFFYTGPMNYSFVPARAFVSGYFPRAELRALLLAKLKNGLLRNFLWQGGESEAEVASLFAEVGFAA